MAAVAPRVRTLLVVLTAVTAGLSAESREPRDAAQVAPQIPGAPGGSGQLPGEQPKGTGLVMGQVVDAATGKPVGGAIVAMTGGGATNVPNVPSEILASVGIGGAPTSGSSAPRQIMTDSDGRYMFRELAHGRYTIRVTAPGYLSGGVGQNRPTGAPQSIELTTDDEKRGDLTVRLWKSASLTGTIRRRDRKPLSGLPGALDQADDERRQAATQPRHTGEHRRPRHLPRSWSLVPGDYLVAVLSTQMTMPVATTEAYYQQMSAGGSSLNSEIYRELNNSDAPMSSMGGYRVGDLMLSSTYGRGGAHRDRRRAMTAKCSRIRRMFYPSASVAAQATVITLASGEDRLGIDLQLKLAPAVRVSGTIMGPDGPARNLGVKLFPAGADDFVTESGIESASTATDAQGVFTFLGVTPGQYTLKSLRIPRAMSTSSPSNMTTIEVSGPNGMIMGMSSGGPSSAPPPPLPTELTLSADHVRVGR